MTQTTDFLSHLNPSQRKAVEHYCGALLVVAGAGSGKTRALTYRIANLILKHAVDPENILAVTFTNKAAREMKERIKKLFAQQVAREDYGKPLEALVAEDKTKLESQVYRSYIKDLWIGTFHSLCARILRFDIEKYQDEKGRSWNKNFSIFDESDVQSVIKEIVTKQLNLDDKKFEPRAVRSAISNAKNQGFSPQDFENDQPNFRGKTIAQVYNIYQTRLAENNALDFDDLILVPVRLFQQNEKVLGYWHRRFHHILADEYQDTNRIQYDLIRLLTTNGETKKSNWDWSDRSIFVVGDVDQSIYSFRGADYTVLLEFQEDFGDGLQDEDTRTMVKLEENYRSRENILQAANHLIENNTQRIEKILKATRGIGEHIYCFKADDETHEADFVVKQIRNMIRQNPELDLGSFAILYRMNAQSRPLEELMVRWGITYQMVGGLKFYDRKEIKDAIAYLRLIVNPSDSLSLKRVINTPRRGIGDTTVDRLETAAQELNVPLWEIISDETSVNSLAGRTAKPIMQFVQVIRTAQQQMETIPPSQIVEQVMEDSGYIKDLEKQGTDEAENRLANIQELYNAVRQFEEEHEEPTLENFLGQASLASDLDNLEEGEKAVSLMTLHSAKGLEFPIVFLVGLEQGLLPHSRSLDNPAGLEEERRLCYVGITRAQEQLFISHAASRRLWGNREPAIRSQFLKELPAELIRSNAGNNNYTDRTVAASQSEQPPTRKTSSSRTVSAPKQDWKVGDRVLHPSFGIGNITHILGSGNKITVAIKFPGIGQKIIDPKIAQLRRVD
ncbi:DNA helicase PcrA [Microcoleus sp. FACHB-831]|uniref:DNA helicase PcrA n=1 Tax=Microcoleus sp. FACHB-831 TaxID=2692827 RepID=UPI001684DFEE|nr:DNA helicase PcrA [Microcoleus sp. FACHB-831]MBD1919897.1 DNA helicase PcrA [Microcoleus sp. FACHB-831]